MSPQEDKEFEDALAKAKSDPCKPRTIVAVYRAPHGKILTAHGVEHRNGSVDIESGHDMACIGGRSGSVQALRERIWMNTQGRVDYTDQPTHVDPAKELKDAAEAAKSEPKKFKMFTVAYRKQGEAVKVAQGIEHPDGSVRVEDGHGIVSGYEPSLNNLRNTMGNTRIEHHIAYMDEA